MWKQVAFVYGSLAPDSGLPNADWTEFEPPKEVTHFLHKGEGENTIRDYLFYQQYLEPVISSGDSSLYSFRLGYFFHLLCDSIWARKLAATILKGFEKEIQADNGKAWNDIKYDWYSLDQVFIHSHPECLFWRVMAVTSNPPSQLPFLSDAAFHHQLDYIRKFYSEPPSEE